MVSEDETIPNHNFSLNGILASQNITGDLRTIFRLKNMRRENRVPYVYYIYIDEKLSHPESRTTTVPYAWP